MQNGPVAWSLALHVAIAVGLSLGIRWPERPRVAVAAAPIQGTIVDTAALERQQQAREEAARRERQRAERQRREAAEQQRLADQREQQRVAAERRAREEAEQKERDRIAAEKAAEARREREAREERERQAQAQREREEAAKRERERAAQRAREEELLRAAAVEAEANAAREAGLLDQYTRMIESKIEQNWVRPLSAREGLDCLVRVVQTLTGDVISVQVASCNGDEAVRRSIEKAVMDASPLPRPPNPALFERNLNVNFRPEE